MINGLIEQIGQTFNQQWKWIQTFLLLPATMARLGEWRGQAKAITEEGANLSCQIGNRGDKHEDVMGGLLGLHYQDYQDRAEMGNSIVNEVESLAGFAYLSAPKGLEATLAFAVMQAWTTYEILATDLWVAAANLRPRGIAISAVNSSKSKSDSGNVKTMSIDNLQKYDFNLRDCMGTMLRDEKKFGFDSLDKIKLAYCAAFGNEKMIEHFGEKRYEQLYFLEITRNVLAHNGGKVDKKYEERAKKYTEYSNIEVNDAVPITGEIVAKFANIAIESGKALLEFVDNWVANNPEN